MSVMRPVLSSLVAALTLFVPHTVAAQNTPKVEAFGGYSYLRLAEQPIENFNAEQLNGWDSSIELNMTPRVGMLANIGGNYGQRLCSVCTTNTNQYTFLIGPEYKVLQSGRMIVNLHVLAGMAHTSSYVFSYEPPRNQYWFAASVGGSVDYRMSDRLTYRIIQPEVLTTVSHFYSGRGAIVDANLRVSSGLLFRFANR